MQIVIVGLGQMGFSLAEELEAEGHDVSGLEPMPDRVEMVRARLDVMAIRGSGVSRAALLEAGAKNADLIVAVSGSDEVNIVSCLIGRELGVQKRLARIESRVLAKEMHELHDVLGIDEFFAPRQVTVEHLTRILASPGTIESADFAGGRIILRGLRVEKSSKLTSDKLSEVRKLFPENFLVTAVRREEELFVPTGDFQIRKGDVIYVTMNAKSFRNFLSAFNLQRSPDRRIIIYGASDAGLDLCRRLTEMKYDIVLLDEDEQKCQRAAERLPFTSVINGQALDSGLMQDLKIDKSTFFALSRRTELNFASVVAAKRLGAHYAVMLATNPEEVEMFDRPPVDVVVNPITLSVGAILRSVRAGRVITLFKLAGKRAEALEIVAEKDTSGTGSPLRELVGRFPAGAVVAAVESTDGAHVASGETVIKPGDHVIAVALKKAVPEVIRLFSAENANGPAKAGANR
ncbi:MAG: Trk system potassium transporter TrkA [Planctomycetota bacterium]